LTELLVVNEATREHVIILRW